MINFSAFITTVHAVQQQNARIDWIAVCRRERMPVYFDLEGRYGLALPVIPTCRAGEIDKLHFDIKHLNTLVWKTAEELADLLAKRIRAVLGPRPDAK